MVHGDHRGRLLGFPTANLDLSAEIPLADGVYAGSAVVHYSDGRMSAELLAAISVGTNPQFHGQQRRFEVHLLDFDEEIYGDQLAVTVHQHIRSTQVFNSVAELIAQIDADCQRVRELSALPSAD